MKNFTAVFENAEEGGYIGWIEEMPEAMSQGETLAEVRDNLLDALYLLIEVNREIKNALAKAICKQLGIKSPFIEN